MPPRPDTHSGCARPLRRDAEGLTSVDAARAVNPASAVAVAVGLGTAVAMTGSAMAWAETSDTDGASSADSATGDASGTQEPAGSHPWGTTPSFPDESLCFPTGSDSSPTDVNSSDHGGESTDSDVSGAADPETRPRPMAPTRPTVPSQPTPATRRRVRPPPTPTSATTPRPSRRRQRRPGRGPRPSCQAAPSDDSRRHAPEFADTAPRRRKRRWWWSLQ